MIQTLKNKILAGGEITADEAYALADMADSRLDELLDAAGEITRARCSRQFDSCSIVNARSGRCPEDCKFCAQSARHDTRIDTYAFISREECLRHAEANRRQGIRRFSLVASGRLMTGTALATACSYISEIKSRGGLQLCASMGLLGREELKALKAAGVTRYHCNLEAAPSYFHTLCSTHTTDDKIRTIELAREVGLEVCSGGIIGMGESRRQRVELALELRRVRPCSIPVNILSPIKGTPLEDAAPLPESEVLIAVALFRFVHPDVTIRFAGGRAALSRKAQARALDVAVNGTIMGDMLTTVGSAVADDKRLIADAGYQF